MMDPDNDPKQLALPRILCLHGGGTSAEIFQIQCRVIIKRLQGIFRLVFVDAPFTSRPHPAIVPYFGDEGTFYRWLRWNDDEPYDNFAEAKILDCIETAMRTDGGRDTSTPGIHVSTFLTRSSNWMVRSSRCGSVPMALRSSRGWWPRRTSSRRPRMAGAE